MPLTTYITQEVAVSSELAISFQSLQLLKERIAQMEMAAHD